MKVHLFSPQSSQRVIPLQILEMEPDSLWDGGGGKLALQHIYLMVREMKDNLLLPLVGQLLRQERKVRKAFPGPFPCHMNVNRSLIESSSLYRI